MTTPLEDYTDAQIEQQWIAEIRDLMDRRRRARRNQRLAIALCFIGAVILLVWEALL